MSRDHIQKSVSRFLERDDGKTITVINVKETEKLDEERDPILDKTRITVDKWSVDWSSDVAALQDSSGTKHTSQNQIYIPGDVDVYFGLESDKRHPSIIEINNQRWKVIKVQSQAFGALNKIFAKSQEIAAGDPGYANSF